MPMIQTVIALPCPHALGLHATVWQTGSYRGGFCEKLLEASSMPGKANPWWLSKIDIMLAKARPIRNGGNASVVADL